MVVGKNTQSLARAAAPTPKLPPLPKLRVRRPDRTDANPCIGVMSTVLGKSRRNMRRLKAVWITDNGVCAGCWASQGYSTQGCAALEQQLRACMDAKVRWHLSFYRPKNQFYD